MRRSDWLKDLVRYLHKCYTDIENMTIDEFNIAADQTIWPEYMHKMRKGTDVVQILIETDVVELLKHIKEYEDLRDGGILYGEL